MPPTSNFQPIKLFDRDCCYKFIYLFANSADPDQLASSEANLKKPTYLDLHCLKRQGISRFSRTRVKYQEMIFGHVLMTASLVIELIQDNLFKTVFLGSKAKTMLAK